MPTSSVGSASEIRGRRHTGRDDDRCGDRRDHGFARAAGIFQWPRKLAPVASVGFGSCIHQRRAQSRRAPAASYGGDHFAARESDPAALRRWRLLAPARVARRHYHCGYLAEASRRFRRRARIPAASRRYSAAHWRAACESPRPAEHRERRSDYRRAQDRTAGDAMSARRGFTLLEVLVATTVMGIAVVTLMAGLSTSARNASRLTYYDRVALLARAKMDALLVDPSITPATVMEQPLDPSLLGGARGGWRAQLPPFGTSPPPVPGAPGPPPLPLYTCWIFGVQPPSFRVQTFPAPPLP